MLASTRKDDHLRLAAAQRHEPATHTDFDDVELVHDALAAIDVAAVDLNAAVGPWRWPAPLYINGMTGGSDTATRVNRTLAAAARETGLPMGSGSAGIAIDDPSFAGSFTVIREENPDGFVMANIGAGRPAEHGVRAVELLQANALQLHLNAVQELVMPEGSREFSDWLRGVEATVAASPVPVIVKEVGFGLSRDTLRTLASIGVQLADVSGSGGTNFARIESARGGGMPYLAAHGLSTVSCLLDARAAQDAAPGHPAEPLPELLASGGVRHAFDVVKALALGAHAVGVAGGFVTFALERDLEATIGEMRRWLAELRMLHALFGAPTPAALAHVPVLVRGRVREFAELRGVDVTLLASRSRSILNS